MPKMPLAEEEETFGNVYKITVNDLSLEFEVWKNGGTLFKGDYKNIEWAVQSLLSVVKRTEGEVRRRKRIEEEEPCMN